MKDFYCEVMRALQTSSTHNLLVRWNADPNIKLSTSPVPVLISKYAFCKSESGLNSLEHIFNRSGQLNKEIAFSGIFDEQKLLVIEFVKGTLGDCNACDWNAGTLLEESYKKTRTMPGNIKVSLGHTHPLIVPKDGSPPRPYGAICSKVYYDKSDLINFDDEISLLILKSKLYEKYGGDYCEMLKRTQTINLISSFFWILSPRSNQIGVFEIKEKGHVIYHPWQITVLSS